MFRVIYCLLCLLVCLPKVAITQDAEETRFLWQEVERARDFDKNKWEKAKQGIDYSKDVARERKRKEKPTNGKGPNEAGTLKRWLNGDASPVLKVLLILFAIAAVLLLLRVFLGLNQPKNKKIAKPLSEADVDEIEHNLQEANLEQYIEQAISDENYRLAIRLYYLMVLQALVKQQWIDWQRDKTNRDYWREMQRTPMADAFGQITLLFERIWYGESAIGVAEFNQIEPSFKSFIAHIQSLITADAL